MTSSRDRTVRIWDATTGQPAQYPLVHDDFSCFAAFCTERDCVVTAAEGSAIRLWTLPRIHPSTSVERTVLSIETKTGINAKTLASLDVASISEKRQILAKRHGGPITVYGERHRYDLLENWHRRQCQQAIENRDVYALAFNLRLFIFRHQENEDSGDIRLERAVKYLGDFLGQRPLDLNQRALKVSEIIDLADCGFLSELIRDWQSAVESTMPS